MFVKVKVKDNYSIGSIVSFDNNLQLWTLADNQDTPVGIIASITYNEDTSEYMAKTYFAGTCWALADRDIPDEGGKLAIINGKAYVDNSQSHSCGIISPLPQGQNSRIANDLILVFIR